MCHQIKNSLELLLCHYGVYHGHAGQMGEEVETSMMSSVLIEGSSVSMCFSRALLLTSSVVTFDCDDFDTLTLLLVYFDSTG